MPKERARQRRAQSLIRSLWWAGGLAVAAAIVLIVLSPRPLPTTAVIPTSAPRPYAGEGKTLGSPDAPVVMEEYSDFQCPYCGRFATDALRRIEEEYIATGNVRFVYYHFAFLGEESVRAAEASECAGEQGHVWDYLDTLFANQNGENRGAFADAYLKSFAEGLGLDMLEFNRCLDTRRYRSVVLQETQEGRRRGVTSTPTFFINGELSAGLLPFEGYKELIDKALAAQGG